MNKFSVSFLISFIFFCFSHLSAATYIPAIIKIYDDEDYKELEEEGIIISRQRGDLLLCLVPTQEEQATRTGESSSKKVKKADIFNKKDIISPVLDNALNFYKAYSIQDGTAFGSPYTGKGIVAGFCDTGIDPLHPTFISPNGNARVKKLTRYKESEGIREELNNSTEFDKWITDDFSSFHATHVGGILAGNGANSPYKGVASEADIVVSVSELSSYGILMGVEDIIDYARAEGKPAVINLSLASYTGPHDGTSLFSQYLDLCASEAVIVVSAGNEGSGNISMRHEFTESSPIAVFRLGNKKWDQINMYGATDIWNSTDSPLEITISVYDDGEYKTVYDYEMVCLSDHDVKYYVWDENNVPFADCSLRGYLAVMGGVDPENGRYNATIAYDFSSENLTPGGWAKDVIKVTVKGKEGEDVEIFADGTYTRLMGSGAGSPSPQYSISDLACGYNVISVGMYDNDDSMEVSPHSSYGTLRDGRILPTTLAPGADLISAGSRPYLQRNPSYPHIESAGTYWISLNGTSMASPYVAGYIATMLQACPELTGEDIMSLIEKSNSTDIPDPFDVHCLNGYFDPVSAFALALGSGSVDRIDKEDFSLSADDLIEVYNLSGLPVYKGKAEGCNNLPPSVYIIRTSDYAFKRRLSGSIFHK